MDSEPSKPGVLPTLWIVVAVVAGILILGDLNRRMSNARRLEREARQAQAVVASLEAEQARLETQMAAATSGALVEDWARREAKMALPGERLVVPIPAAGGTPTPWPTPTPLPPLPSNWEVWWALLFGG
ncbi:MAG: hypothetical protein AB1449_02800 [Chloroflexota bacterium]